MLESHLIQILTAFSISYMVSSMHQDAGGNLMNRSRWRTDGAAVDSYRPR